jgi:hypothetical protein
MVLPEVKYTGSKMVSQWDLRVDIASGRTTSKDISFNIGT